MFLIIFIPNLTIFAIFLSQTVTLEIEVNDASHFAQSNI